MGRMKSTCGTRGLACVKNEEREREEQARSKRRIRVRGIREKFEKNKSGILLEL